MTGERIRDKKLATAKKGLWGSGSSSFGYKLEEKKLIPNEEEVPKLRRIFDLYLKLKSVRELRYALIEEDISTRTGRSFESGNLYELLKRKVYIGKVEHRGETYDGIHEPILDEEIFSQVQELLKENNNSHNRRYKVDQPSLFSGKIYDDNDFIMSPSNAVKNGKRYRYYLSQAYLQKKNELAGSLAQVPAQEIEQTSSDFIKRKLEESLKLENHSIEKYQIYKTNLENYLQNWNLQNRETHFIIRQILVKVIISSTQLTYYLNPITIQDIFELIITRQNILDYESKIIDLKECKIFMMECELKRINQGKTLIIGSQNVQKNEGVIKLLKQAWKWCEDIEKGVEIKEIAGRENISSSYINKVLKMRFLSPRIQKMILTGENRDLLTSHILRKVISTNFQEQEKQLGI